MTRRVFTPSPAQEEMLEWMYDHPRCGIWARMGAGKTSAALTFAHQIELVEPGRSLALGPLTVAREVWPAEAAKWEHLRAMGVIPIIGTQAERIAALRLDASLHTINYDVIPWLIEYLAVNKKKWRWSRVFADEATRLKNFRVKGGGQRARAIGRVAHSHVRRWVNFSGTPSPNGLKDLWGSTWFIDEGARLGRTLGAFEERWFRWVRRPNMNGPNYEIKQVPAEYAQQQIQDALRDVCITPYIPDDDEEVINLPVRVKLPPQARRQYDDMERNLFTELEGIEIEAFNAASKSIKCLQMASGIVWADREKDIAVEVHDRKLQALESIIEEAAGAPILVRYHWVPNLRRILKAFPQAKHFNGSRKMIDDWNAGRIPVMVLHAQSAGHGHNLQDGGNILVSYDHWWALEEAQQIIERIGPLRQKQSGHPRPVYHYQIVAEDTLDEDVILRIESKRSVQDVLLEAMQRRGRRV